MNNSAFYASVRHSLFNSSLTPKQFEGLQFILKSWATTGFTNRRWLAYAMATAYHETARTMQPIKEYGGTAYFRRMYDISGERPYKARELGNFSVGDGVRYAGRGYVQLTGKSNYDRAGRTLGIDMIRDPDLALDPSHAAHIMFRGMHEGWFTGRKFSTYLSGPVADYVGARRIINGTDQATKISRYAVLFEAALSDAGMKLGSLNDATVTQVPEPTIGGSGPASWLTTLINAITGMFKR